VWGEVSSRGHRVVTGKKAANEPWTAGCAESSTAWTAGYADKTAHFRVSPAVPRVGDPAQEPRAHLARVESRTRCMVHGAELFERSTKKGRQT